MQCAVEYCIYNRNGSCICKNIQINALGMCEECMLVRLDEDFLEIEKNRQLWEIEERWRKETY